MTILYVLLAIAAVIVIFIVVTYNKLIRYQNAYENAFSQIDVQLQRRHDLIPNLIEVAKGYLKHERETLDAVVSARAAAQSGLDAAKKNPGDPAAMKQLSKAEGSLDSALGRLVVVVEDYPDLKANENMMQLTEELSSTENKVAFARQAYNDGVMTYNNAREVFPANFVAGVFNFKEAEHLELENPEARIAPKVSF